MLNTKAIDELMNKGIDEEIFPGAAISVGDKNGELFRKTYGFRQLVPQKTPWKQTLYLTLRP